MGQDADRFAQTRSADAELDRQLRFGQQLAAGRQLAGSDFLAQGVCDALDQILPLGVGGPNLLDEAYGMGLVHVWLVSRIMAGLADGSRGLKPISEKTTDVNS